MYGVKSRYRIVMHAGVSVVVDYEVSCVHCL